MLRMKVSSVVPRRNCLCEYLETNHHQWSETLLHGGEDDCIAGSAISCADNEMD
jgi:hypothetical protein